MTYLCEECKKREGTPQPDPYRKEVWDEIYLMILCKECYFDRCMEI